MTLERLRAALVTTAFCVATLSPLVRDDEGRRRDGFPLSWYPMFSKPRPELETVNWVRAQEGTGRNRPVSVNYWTRGGLTEGRAQLEGAIKAGPESSARFCERLAATFAKRTRGWESRVTELQLTRSTWALESYFGANDPNPRKERVLLTCAVNR